MPCYHPIEVTPPGHERSIQVPCGRCIGCRVETSRRWAVRIMCEAHTSPVNCFLTLTYENLPSKGSLNKKDIQLFLKRLRKKTKLKLTYFQCGEYGEKMARPHYHMCLFGYNFPDRQEYLEPSKSGHPQYVSAELNETWSLGMCWISELTFESAQYVAGYVTKKYSNKSQPEKEKEHYGNRLKEFATMSRNPALGKRFVERFYDDIYKNDTLIMRGGKKLRPPRYFDDQFYKDHKKQLAELKEMRKINRRIITIYELSTLELEAKEKCRKHKRDYYAKSNVQHS